MEKSEDSKQRILKAATKLFAHKGFEGTSIREICKEANVNVCMISYYWGGKKELYHGIVDELIKRQLEYISSFADIEKSPYDMTQNERIDLINLWLDKVVDLFYSDFISEDLILLLLKEQQQPTFVFKSQALSYFRSIVGAILGKKADDKEVVFKTLFIISQINSPRILKGFSLRLLGQDKFYQEDIKIIKDNLKSYVSNLIKEASLD